jgi:hypothetical protein
LEFFDRYQFNRVKILHRDPKKQKKFSLQHHLQVNYPKLVEHEQALTAIKIRRRLCLPGGDPPQSNPGHLWAHISLPEGRFPELPAKTGTFQHIFLKYVFSWDLR